MTRLHRRELDRQADSNADPDALLVRWSQQNPQAFTALYDRYFSGVYGYCLSQLHDQESAEDATSQTFMKALAALSTYRETGHFRPWLFAIAHNAIQDSFRRNRADEQIEAAESRPDTAPNPEDLAIAALDVAWLNSVIDRLPENDRHVLELRRAGLHGAEIASVLGISHAAAKKRQLRAIDRIRDELNANPAQLEVRRGAKRSPAR